MLVTSLRLLGLSLINRNITSKRTETAVMDILLRQWHEGTGTRDGNKFTRMFTLNALICRAHVILLTCNGIFAVDRQEALALARGDLWIMCSVPKAIHRYTS